MAMRTREEVFAATPLMFDVLVYTDGRWERHAKLTSIPSDPDALFPTEAADLVQIYPNLTNSKLYDLVVELTGSTPGYIRSKKTDPYAYLWWALRKMDMTVKGQRSITQAIPKTLDIPTSYRVPLSERGIRKVKISGHSLPDSERGVQEYQVIYRPGMIEAQDVKFAELPRLAQQVVRVALKATADSRKKVIGRREFAALLEEDAKMIELTGSTPWDSFVRYRARLARQEFIVAHRQDGK